MELIAKAIGQILVDDTDVTDITTSGNICFGQFAPGTDAPIKLRFFPTSVEPYDSKIGAAIVDEYTVLIEIFGIDSATMANLAKAVRETLDQRGFQEVNEIRIQGIRFVGGGFNPDEPDETDESTWRLYFEVRVERGT